MKNKAPLALMEQLVMVLVFALAAALCLQVFVLSDKISRNCEARDHAVLAAQNVAETLKSCGGDHDRASRLLGGGWDGQQWIVGYDEKWQKTEKSAAYYVKAVPADSGQALLGTADITVYETEGETLFTLTVAWQEVDADAGT